MTKEFRDKKDDKPTNKNSNEMPSLKDYKSKEELDLESKDYSC
jgi:hypothetical protein